MRRVPIIQFPSRKAFVQEHIPTMLKRTMNIYLHPTIASCVTMSITFNLWMSRCRYTTLGTIINFIEDTWTLRHVVVGLFGVANTSSVALTKIVKSFLNVFLLTDKIMAYVKDKDANLNTLADVHQSIVSCKSL